MNNPLNQHYWDLRYEQNQLGWDLGTVSPPLKSYFDQVEDKSLKILIPGGGNSYEAEYLMQQGFTDVTVVDVSGVVIGNLRRRFATYLDRGLTLVHQDFFEHGGQYDLIVEQTFFCALNPSLRPDYVQHMEELLSERGELVGVLFDRDFVGGPPFGGHREEYRSLISTTLNVLTMKSCYNSVPPRMGSEAFLIAQKKQA
jgi:SAM-dependent methyltransferase